MGNASAFELDALDTRIRELVAYARERDGEDRTLLFRNLVDLFLTGKAPQKQPTRSQLLDVIEALVPHVEPDGRRTVAELVANMSEPPLDLACRLAKDRPHLVGDLLRSTAFDEDDIIKLIECTGRDHHHVIASRNDLSANVWIALARAAPAAAPFDNQSTLALWRDDLGAIQDFSDQPTVTPFRTSTEAPAKNMTRAPHDNIDAGQNGPANAVNGQGSPFPTSNQGADQRHAAQLRILRTDKDLIADRIIKSDEPMQTRAATDEEIRGEYPAAKPTTEEISQKETIQGGWVWRSDRDGFVVSVSDGGAHLFGPSVQLVGASILDMLSLNTKLGHPVSRAFQRRSTIHDAPLTLDVDNDRNRFWTLEARPVFSPNGGIFEGYHGLMSPIQPREDFELDFSPSYSSDTPVFIEESRANGTAGLARDEASERLAGNDTITDESIDRTRVPAPKTSTPKAPAPKTSAPEASTPVISASGTRVSPSADQSNSRAEKETDAPNSNPLADIAANVVKDLIGESLAQALGNLGTNSASKQPDRDFQRQEPPKNEPTYNAEEVAATLQIMEQALSALVSNGQTVGNSTLRLQTEIATACLKTLKEQMGKTGSTP